MDRFEIVCATDKGMVRSGNEAAVYGHPAQPKQGPALPAALESVEAANFGITFENDGIRARVELQQ